MKKLKVVLVVPNFKWSKLDDNALWHYIPYNLCLLAAMVEGSCEISILDAYQPDMNDEQFKKEIKRLSPDVVGVTALMDQSGPAAHHAAKLVKDTNNNIITILGGVYATINHLKAIEDKNIDYVIIGEGEFVFRDLIGYISNKNSLPEKGICYRENGQLINKGRSDFIQDLDSLPMPAFHLIDFLKYANIAHRKSVDGPKGYPFSYIITSRGCPFGCCFCQVQHITGKKFRFRSAKNVLDEIEYLKNKYNIKSLVFYDDNLFGSKQRAKDLMQGMIDRNLVMPWTGSAAVSQLNEDLVRLMKKSGCCYLNIAVESGTDRVHKEIIQGKPVDFEHAKRITKVAREEGLYVCVNFMVGFPTETWNEIRQTIKFAEEIDADYIKLFAVFPLRHTRLWDICEKEGLFKSSFCDEEEMWSTGKISTKEFTAEQLTILRAYEWDRINFTDPQKRKRTAEMMEITEEELYEIRKNTLRNIPELLR